MQRISLNYRKMQTSDLHHLNLAICYEQVSC